MTRIIIIVFICLSLNFSQGQEISFNGTLLDAETNEPISYALLYLDGTTVGVTSDENGNFVFNNLSFPIQIEISHLSYKPSSIRYETRIPEKVSIKLSPRAIRLREVLILNRGTRKEYVKRFNKWFVGYDRWGLKAKLLNDSALVFFDEDNGFRVGASEPLIIESKALGYMIRAELKDFLVESDTISGRTMGSYVASYYFTQSEKGRYKKNRARAYYNSSEHFLKSFYEDKLIQNGYEIKEERLNDSTNYKEFIDVRLSSSLVKKVEGEKQITGLKDRNYFILFFCQKNGHPLNLETKTEAIQSKQKGWERYINYTSVSAVRFDDNDITLRSDGTTPGSFIIFSGAIGQKKVGAMLPADYRLQMENSDNASKPEEYQLPDRLIRKRKN